MKKTKVAAAVEQAYRVHPGIKDTATAKQALYIDAVNKHGSERAAARALGLNVSTINAAVAAAVAKASINGFAPDHGLTNRVPPGFKAKGYSTLRDKRTGEEVMQWEKISADDSAREQLMREFALHLAEDISGLAPRIKAPKAANEDLLAIYPMGDPHFGMYAWWRDSGENFDLPTAEALTKAAIDKLVDRAPAAAIGLMINLGDMFHADNQKNTTNSGHQLDVDGRWKKVQMVGLACMVYCIMRMLEKHQRVIFRINGGNHDGHSSYGLALMLSCWFRDEPRVEIDLTPAAFWYYEFGKNLFGTTHGDTIKGDKLVALMAADKPEAWGRTTHRHWFVGHVHHQDSKEYPGGVVEYFRTLAARDAWHAGQGYRAGRDMRLFVIHREEGISEIHRQDAAYLLKKAA